MSASHKRQRRPLFPPAFTVKGLADALHVDRNVIYEAIRAGELIAYQIGSRRFIVTENIVSWIKSHKRVTP
jgi:excisionase family DNA binding protein